MIDKDSIAKMKVGVILLNTARGPLVCESDLADALKSGKVSYAAMDVVETEPIPKDSVLLTAPPSSVTTLYTEERREGIASFRMQSFGDLSHLYAGDEPASFAARFCETYDNMEERHD